jgi:hypothetical protein|tara:strand:- start:301256 stop:302299 length:1044 start_codon:yes stop_codon:yes gene_type:complete
MRIRLIIASVLLLIAGYSFFWFQMAGQVKETTLDWIANSESRLDGAKIYVGDVTVSGFPYKIIVEASSFNAVVPGGRFSADPLSITMPAVAVVFQPWKPNHAIIVSDYFDAVLGPLNAPNVNVSFEMVKSSIILDPATNQLNNLSAVAQRISWYHGAEMEVDESSAMEGAELHLRRAIDAAPAQNSYDLPVNRAVFFKANNVSIGEFASTILGEKADEFRIDALLHANEQPDYTVSGLSKWRDDGGTLSIRKFDYTTTTSGLSLTGDLTLDENLRPLGAFDATVTDMGNFLYNLSKDETISQTTRLMLEGQAQNSSMPDEVPLSISMQNGQLYLGPIMLMELPPLIE